MTRAHCYRTYQPLKKKEYVELPAADRNILQELNRQWQYCRNFGSRKEFPRIFPWYGKWGRKWKSRSKLLSQMLLLPIQITNIRKWGKASVDDIKSSSPWALNLPQFSWYCFGKKWHAKRYWEMNGINVTADIWLIGQQSLIWSVYIVDHVHMNLNACNTGFVLSLSM